MVKQTTREEPGAHPDHVEGNGRAGGTMERRVDGHGDHAGAATVKRGGVHSGHGGENNNDGGEPMTVMDKLTKQ